MGEERCIQGIRSPCAPEVKTSFEFSHTISPVSLFKISVSKINTKNFKLISDPGDINRS